MLHRMLTVLALPVPTINDGAFFSPGNYTPETFSTYNAMHSGNFNHYTKTSFAISSVGIPLSFEHTYNSYLSEIPPQFTPMKPLGKLWSHTYNSYITEIEGDILYPEDFRVVVALPNNGFHVYKLEDGNYKSITNGVYSVLEKPTTNTFTITTKNQIVYTYEKITGTAPDFPYVLVSVHDRNSNTMTITYEVSQNTDTPDFQRIKEVVGTAGRKLLFTYHPNSDLINYIEDPLNRKVYYTYDANDILVEFKDAKNQSTFYNYGSAHESDLLMSIQLPKGNTITNTYENKKLASSQTNGNQPTSFVYDQNYGQTAIEDFTNTTVTNPNGQVTNIDYNKFGYPNAIQKDTYINVSLGYNDTQISKPNNITINNKNVVLDYDDRGNITSMNLPMGVSHTYSYNAYNDVIQYIDPIGENYTYGYDGNGNLTSISTPRGSTSLTVNNLGLVTQSQNPEGITTTYAYDVYGNTISTSAPEGITTSATFDMASRLLSFTNANGFSTNYNYDDNDNLLEETFNTQTTQYAYDPNDNLTQIKNANNKNTVLTYDFENDFLENVAFEGDEDAYTYQDDGKVETYTNPNGVTFTYTYNTTDGRLSTISSSGDTVSYTYDNNNNITQISNSNGSTSYSYDALNRITSVTDYFGNIVSYEYDLNSNVTKIIYPDNKEVIYTYYPDNLLHTVEDWNNQMTTYTYRNDALLSKVTYANGTYCDYSYDNAGRMIDISWKKTDSNEFIAYNFTLDAMGNHLTETKWEPYISMGQANETIDYSYTNANRIQTAGSNSFSFNANGNTLSKTGNTYTYDNYDRLTNLSNGSTNAQYEYDANGNRTKSVVNGLEKRFVLNTLGMSNVLAETNSSNTIQNYYVYGLGLISRTDNSNQTNYYHYDFRGSTIAMTDTNKTITHKYQYDEFGNLQQSDEANYNAYRYVGKYGVSYESNDLYFMRARFYDPSIGRFLSEDPIWHTNLYPYADNNPITGIDPKGEIRESIEYISSNVENSKTITQPLINYASNARHLADIRNAGNLEMIQSGKEAAKMLAQFVDTPEEITTTATITKTAPTVAASTTTGVVVGSVAIAGGTLILGNEGYQIYQIMKNEDKSFGQAFFIERPNNIGNAFDLKQYKWFPFKNFKGL